jgi:hypothetical protein
MRLRVILPVLGLLALSACNDGANQTGSTNNNGAPANTTTAPATPGSSPNTTAPATPTTPTPQRP